MTTVADPNTTVETLTIQGEGISANVIERVTAADVEVTISGASTFTLTMNDDNRKILKSGLFSKRNHAVVDTRSYEMVRLDKQGDALTATFEDTIVAALRKHTDPLKVDAGTMTHVDFARRLVQEVPGIRFVAASSANLSTEVLHRGPVNPTGAEKELEDSWDAIGRIANARQWRRFVREGAIWYVTDAYLFAQASTYSWKEYQDGVDFIDFGYDTGHPVGTAEITVRAGRWAIPPGITIDVSDIGPASGKYLVAKYSRSLFSLNGTVELTIPLPDLPEPDKTDGDLSQYDTFEAGLVTDGSDSGTGGAGDSGLNDVFGTPTSLSKWVWPTTGHTISGKYGEARSTPTPHKHEGVDIAVKKGSPVFAANAGIVTFEGQQSGFGNLIIIKHAGGLETYYAHVYVFNCYKGQAVKAGDLIAKSGGHPGDPGAGDSRGDHLHFQVNLNGRPVDPANYVGR